MWRIFCVDSVGIEKKTMIVDFREKRNHTSKDIIGQIKSITWYIIRVFLFVKNKNKFFEILLR
jgi:hypothetical protein